MKRAKINNSQAQYNVNKQTNKSYHLSPSYVLITENYELKWNPALRALRPPR